MEGGGTSRFLMLILAGQGQETKSGTLGLGAGIIKVRGGAGVGFFLEEFGFEFGSQVSDLEFPSGYIKYC